MSDLVKKEQQTTDLTSDLFEGIPTGFEETNNETYKMPFVKILQDLSPECKKETKVEGAEPGLFFNTVTKVMKDEMNVIVLKIVHNLVVWKPNRGGFVGVFDKSLEDNITARKEGLKKIDKDGNDIIDTVSFFCLDTANPIEIFVMSLSKTGLKHAQSWASQIRMLTYNGKPVGRAFAGIWNIKTVPQKNDKGSWYDIGKTPTFKGFINKEILEKFVKPALEVINKAEVDYSQTKGDDAASSEEVEY